MPSLESFAPYLHRRPFLLLLLLLPLHRRLHRPRRLRRVDSRLPLLWHFVLEEEEEEFLMRRH